MIEQRRYETECHGMYRTRISNIVHTLWAALLFRYDYVKCETQVVYGICLIQTAVFVIKDTYLIIIILLLVITTTIIINHNNTNNIDDKTFKNISDNYVPREIHNVVEIY